MTTSQIIAAAITWTAVAVACWEHGRARRAASKLRKERRSFTIPGDSVVTFDRKLTEQEMEQIRTEWLRRHGGQAREILRHDEEEPGA